MIIRTSLPALATTGANQLKNRTMGRSRQYIRRSHRSKKPTAVASYIGVFLFIVSIVAIGYQPPQQGSIDNVASAASSQDAAEADAITAPSVDQLVATQVAAAIAERTELPIARNVAQLSVTLSIESELAQTESNVISKPQIIQPSAGNRDIRSYETVAGDTVAKVAAQFGISSETLKWANNLTSDALEPGRTLQILPVNGILYTVKDGDSLQSIAERYHVEERIIESYNDLEERGLSAGQKLILLNGELPDTERPGYVAPRQPAAVTFGPVTYGAGFGGTRTWTIGYGTAPNSYAPGNCTAYAYNRRVQLGKPVGRHWGNAATWAYMAAASGLVVNNTPSVGAIMQNGGGYGHVAIVEEILPNGDISISEMNAHVPGGGFNIVSGRIVPAGNVGSYNYIH